MLFRSPHLQGPIITWALEALPASLQAAACCPSTIPSEPTLLRASRRPVSLWRLPAAPPPSPCKPTLARASWRHRWPMGASRRPVSQRKRWRRPACPLRSNSTRRGAGDEGAAIAPRAWEAPELLREGAGGAAKPRSHPNAKSEPGPSARVLSEAFCAALGGRATAAPNFEEP